MSFEDDLKRFRLKTMAKYEKVKRTSVFDLFTAIVLSTPVDKGVLRNNWFIAHGTPSTEITGAPAESQEVISRAQTEINRGSLDKDTFVTNNLPYAIPIEFDGHSAQAPGGMVRIHTVRWDQIVRHNARKIARE